MSVQDVDGFIPSDKQTHLGGNPDTLYLVILGKGLEKWMCSVRTCSITRMRTEFFVCKSGRVMGSEHSLAQGTWISL